MKKYVIVAISSTYVHRMTTHYAHRKLAEDASRRLTLEPNNRGIVFRVEEVWE